MWKAITSRLGRENGQATFILGVTVEALLMVLLGLGLLLQRMVVDHVRAEAALSLAAQSACRSIALPVGPGGPRLDAMRAKSVFLQVLAADFPTRLYPNQSSAFEIASPGTVDARTGYTFRAEGVMTSLVYGERFLGKTIRETLDMDTEVAWHVG